MKEVREMTTRMVSPEQRHMTFARALNDEMAKRDTTILAQTEFSALILHEEKIKHWAHGFLTVLTIGLWGFVYLPYVIVVAVRKHKIELIVDERGVLHRTKVK